MKKGIYKFNCNCGRSGTLNGVFVADIDMVNWLIESQAEVYFGEVLGKHSEVYGSIQEKEIELITTDEKMVQLFEEFNLDSGYNPLNYPILESSGEEILGDDYEDDLMISEVYEKILENNKLYG